MYIRSTIISKGKMIALNGVNLDIAENEFICVVGPSAAASPQC